MTTTAPAASSTRLQALLEQPLEDGGGCSQVGASIGSVSYSDGSEQPEVPLARADEAMCAVKSRRGAIGATRS